MTICGTGTTRLDHLHALLELVTEHRRSSAGLWRLDTNPALLLDSLHVAVAVLTEPDQARGGHHRRAARAAERGRPVHPNRPGQRPAPPPAQRASRRPPARDRRPGGRVVPSTQLTFRVGGGRPRYPEPGLQCGRQEGPLRGGQLPLRVIPQLLWPGLLSDHLAAAAGLCGVGGSDPAGAMVVARACAAMFLASLGSTHPWRLIAIELGLPAWLADQPVALHRRLVESGRCPAFLTNLDRLATILENDLPPPDYQARRQLGADPQRLVAAARVGRLLADDTPADVPSAPTTPGPGRRPTDSANTAPTSAAWTRRGESAGHHHGTATSLSPRGLSPRDDGGTVLVDLTPPQPRHTTGQSSSRVVGHRSGSGRALAAGTSEELQPTGRKG